RGRTRPSDVRALRRTRTSRPRRRHDRAGIAPRVQPGAVSRQVSGVSGGHAFLPLRGAPPPALRGWVAGTRTPPVPPGPGGRPDRRGAPPRPPPDDPPARPPLAPIPHPTA